MMVRGPAVAGMFYRADADGCRREVATLLTRAEAALRQREASAEPLPARIVGGIVPHAGYVFSGEVAARTLAAIAATRSEDGPAVFVIFGAMHRPRGREGRLFDRGAWETPLGNVEIDERLAGRLLDSTNIIVADPDAHVGEHSIEVQLPLIRHRFAGAKILPILVPPIRAAVDIGRAVARTLEIFDVDAVVLASTDLTHYGPRYGFTPAGVGSKAIRWAMQENDAPLLLAVCDLDADAVVPEAEAHASACGSGAVAAALAAAAKLGATRGVVLAHTSSHDIAHELFHEPPEDAVSYLSAVLG